MATGDWLRAGGEAKKLLDELTPMLADSMFAYLFMACMGEARHAVGGMTKDYFSPQLGFQGSSSRLQVYENALEYDPEASIPALIKIFDQSWGGNSYGGQKWLDIVNGMAGFFNKKWTKGTFIDHVVDLHHNGGTAFSKTECKEVIEFSVNYVGGTLNQFLYHKFNKKDILDNFPQEAWVTRRVYVLLQSILPMPSAIGATWPFKILPPSHNWSWTPVKWGKKVLTAEKKVTPNRDVRVNGNKITEKEAYAILPRCYYPVYVFTELVTPETYDDVLTALKEEFDHDLPYRESKWSNTMGSNKGFEVYVRAETKSLNRTLRLMKKEVMPSKKSKKSS